MADASSGGRTGRLCPSEDYNDADANEDGDDEEIEDDEHDGHNDATDMIGRRKTTKYFFQK